jgi:O-glycosyl hydrolase
MCVSLYAQELNINIRGKVSNSAGNPIAKAILTLAGQPGMKDTTDSDGSYMITSKTSISHQVFIPHNENINLHNGILQFSLPEPLAVKVEIFDVKGMLLFKDVMQTAPTGFYSLNVAGISHTGNLLVIKASIGNHPMTFRYIPLKNGNLLANTANGSMVPNGAKLEKVATAINDTLKITADNFVSKSIAITNYNQVLNITLDSANGTIVHLDQTKQTIVGFGINIALAPNSLGSTVMNALFGTSGTDALGLSVLRVGMNTNGTLSGSTSDISIAKNAGAKIIGSCWSAPATCKDNGRTDQGGHLLANCRDSWATTIANFAKQQNLYAMSIANESDFASCKSHGPPCTDDYETMVYTAKEMVEFVKVAGPKLKANGIKVIAPEASEWVHVWSTASATGSEVAGHPESTDPLGCGCYSNDGIETGCAQKCLNGDGYNYGHWLAKDSVAWKAFDILGVHEYDSQRAYAWPADVTGGVRTKEIWQTEMSGVKYWPEQGPNTTIENGVAIARWIQSALMVGEASVWCWWWYQAYYQNDNEGLAIVQNTSTKAKRYYTMGNYSRYIRPGQKVVNITGADKLPAKVLLTASKDDNGKVVIVAVNETTSEQTVPITIAGGTVPASFTPYVTADGNKNWAEGTAVSVSGGVLTVKLEKMSVTTFVSK